MADTRPANSYGLYDITPQSVGVGVLYAKGDLDGRAPNNAKLYAVVNGQIGMLFIAFEAQLHGRINGRAHIIEDRRVYAELWQTA